MKASNLLTGIMIFHYFPIFYISLLPYILIIAPFRSNEKDVRM